MEARVVDDRPLRVGDELTFFYPSTEWEMDRPFRCRCGAGEGKCLGWIDGAKVLASRGRMDRDGMGRRKNVLEGYWLNGHVREMLEKEKEKRRRVEGRG